MNGPKRSLLEPAQRQMMPGMPFSPDFFTSDSVVGGIYVDECSQQFDDYSTLHLKGNLDCRSSVINGHRSPPYPICDIAYTEPLSGTASMVEGWGQSTPLSSPLNYGPRSINPCSLSSEENSIGYVSPPALSTSSRDSRPHTYNDDLDVFHSIPSSRSYFTQLNDTTAYRFQGGAPTFDPSNGHAYRNPLQARFNNPQLFSFHGSPVLGPRSPVISWPRSPRSSPFTPYDEASSLDGVEAEESASDKPYAKLIWEAMMEQPDKRMTLREIYDWFSKRTNKVKESGGSGWQNSIRHNLSMNQAFESEKGDSCGRNSTKKSSNVWILTPTAIERGVESTTRYRNKCAGKKMARTKEKAARRMASGARGGRAAKRSAKQRADRRTCEQNKIPDTPLQLKAEKRRSPPEGQTSSGLPYASPSTLQSPITPILESHLSSRGSNLVKHETMSSDLIFGIDRLQSTTNAGSGKCEPLIEQPEDVWPSDPYLTEMLNMQQMPRCSDIKPLNA